MKHLVRGTAGLVAAIGVLAGCADDPALDLAGAPTRILVNPSYLFINQGDSQAVRIRTINDLNNAVLAKYEITNVGAGVAVNFDARYRPDYINGADTLAVPELKYEQRYFVKALAPVATTFQVQNGNLSSTVNVAIVPDTLQLGAGLNKTTAALGEEVRVSAPATLRFNDNSTVTFDVGGAAVITARAADGSSITFLPRPGTSGTARVSNVTMRYAPAVAGQNMRTTNTLTIPAVTSIPAVHSKTTGIGAAEVITMTAAGFKFLPTTTVSYGTRAAFVISVSADSNTVTLLAPTGLANVVPTISNAVLSFLPAVPLVSVPGTQGITTGTGYTALTGTATPTAGTSPEATIGATGAGVFFADAGAFTGADIIGGGGPLKWYRLTNTPAATRRFIGGWNNSADVDVYLTNAGVSAFVNTSGGTSANPEAFNQALAANTSYWIVAVLYEGSAPSEFLITVR